MRAPPSGSQHLGFDPGWGRSLLPSASFSSKSQLSALVCCQEIAISKSSKPSDSSVDDEFENTSAQWRFIGANVKFVRSPVVVKSGQSSPSVSSPVVATVTSPYVPSIMGTIAHSVPVFALPPSTLMYIATSYLLLLTIRSTVKAIFTLSSVPRQAPNTTPVGMRGPPYGDQHEIGVVTVPQSTAGCSSDQSEQVMSVSPPQLQLHGGSASESVT